MRSHPVPFLDLVGSHKPYEEDFVKVVRNALRSAAFVGGPEVETFEQEFAAFCGAKECVGVASGTDALRFALIAAGIGRGDAVLTVSFTFVATVEAISQAGAATEFVDIDEATCTMSPTALDDYLSGCRIDPVSGRPLGRRTGKPLKAIVPVHLYGQMADMSSVLRLAERYGLAVVEDACQAHGAACVVDGVWRRAGSVGLAAAFSFYPGKNLGACGEAGAVTTDVPELAHRVRMLRDHGQVQKYHHALEGYNGRLDAIQAGFLRIKLRHLHAWNDERRARAARYAELLAGVAGIVAPLEARSNRSVYHLYVVRTSLDRDALAAHLRANEIATGLHYPVPAHRQHCYRDWGYVEGSLRETERAAAEVVSLPMFPELTAEQQARVVAAIKDYVRTATLG